MECEWPEGSWGMENRPNGRGYKCHGQGRVADLWNLQSICVPVTLHTM